MTHIHLERTIWPVGHGAFYTEQFKDEKNNVLFTAVYDCGSEQEKILEKCIKEFIPEKGQLVIDVLFISHFHADHVNKLSFLLNRNVHVRNLFIPQLSDEYVLSVISTNTYNRRSYDQIISILQRLYNGEQIERIENIYEVPQIHGDNIPREEYPPQDDIRKRNHQIAPLTFQVFSFWIYIPCNIFAPCPQIIREFIKKGYVNNGNLDMNHVFADLQAGNWKNIQEIYGNVYGENHNEYSMPVYSGLVNGAALEELNCHAYVNCSNRRECYYCCHEFAWNTLGCLYTGDFEAKTHSNTLINFYNSNHDAWERTWMMQIPHHGSYENYNEELYRHPKLTFASAAIADKYNHPHVQTLINIASMGCPIVIVQDNKLTSLALIYDIVIN